MEHIFTAVTYISKRLIEWPFVAHFLMYCRDILKTTKLCLSRTLQLPEKLQVTRY